MLLENYNLDFWIFFSLRSKRFREAKSEERGFRRFIYRPEILSSRTAQKNLSPWNSLLPNLTETLATQAKFFFVHAAEFAFWEP